MVNVVMVCENGNVVFGTGRTNEEAIDDARERVTDPDMLLYNMQVGFEGRCSK